MHFLLYTHLCLIRKLILALYDNDLCPLTNMGTTKGNGVAIKHKQALIKRNYKVVFLTKTINSHIFCITETTNRSMQWCAYPQIALQNYRVTLNNTYK